MNKVRIGVIGAGWWATENHIPHLAERDEVELTSVCKLEEDQLSCLLYTSPSPRDSNLSRMPSSA